MIYRPFLFALLVTSPFTASVDAQTTFTFTLPAAYATSAAAYNSSGTLVRTLWRGAPYLQGSYSANWDGMDDTGASVPAGSYTIKLLYHNIHYAWDGVIGNTSPSFTGDVYTFQGTPSSITFSGTTGLLANGYNEGRRPIRRFDSPAPNSATGVLNVYFDAEFRYIATDGTRYYVADVGSSWDTYHSTFVTSYNLADNSPATFSNGTAVTLSSGHSFSSCADVDQMQPFVSPASGLAVQSTGNILAVAHGSLNVVRFFDKTSGTLLGFLPISNPNGLAFAPNGDLWISSGTTVTRYTGVGSSNTVAAIISGLSQPLAVAVHPTDNDIVLVADGGTNQLIRVYDSNGTPLWTFGQPGGYASNGPSVANDKFQFASGYPVPLAVQSDGSFWVRDSGTERLLHYSSTGAYLDQVAYIASNATSVDANAPARVIGSGWLEYQVDYTKPLLPGDPQATGGNNCWHLVNNWAPSASKYHGFYEGISTVATLSNGRIYGLVMDFSTSKREVVELPSTGPLRFTGILLGSEYSLYPNGDLRHYDTAVTGGIQTVYNQSLAGFDGAGNPQWNPAVVLASSPAGITTPAYHPFDFAGAKGVQFPLTSSNVVISLNVSSNSAASGMHLGGVSISSTNWLWKASPSYTADVPLDGIGSFPIGGGVQNGGNTPMTADRHVMFGYQGEFWNSSEADQFMNFYDDGLFVGQFGTSGDIQTYSGTAPATTQDLILGRPGVAGNAFSPTLVTAGEEVYLWHNDEAEHGGVDRWHVVGAKTGQEMSGTVSLGGTISLTAPPVGIPTALAAAPGNGQISLSWAPVSSATSYKVKYANQSGGPYTLAGAVSSTSAVVTGLTNDIPYYFVVSAVTGSAESLHSYELQATPIDTSIAVHADGFARYQGSISTMAVTSGNVGTGGFAVSLHRMFGTLGLRRTNFGSQGYAIFNHDGAGTDLTNLAPGFGISLGSGWQDYNQFISHRLIVDGDIATSAHSAIHANTAASVDITVPDTNWHTLTVIAPDIFSDPRDDTYTLSPQGASSPAASFSVSEPAIGLNYVIQFKFQGNATLKVQQLPGGNGNSANLSAVFLD